MDNRPLMSTVIAETSRIIDQLDESQLDAKTLCTEWTVRDVLNHITGGATMFAAALEQGSVPDELFAQVMSGDSLGDDWKGSWHAASEHALEAFAVDGALESMVTLPFGQMPGAVAITIAVFDVATHATDLAQATGLPAPSDDVLETALAIGKEMIGPDLRAPGVFGPEQPAAPDAPVATRLLAFAGREV
jgi:uncharacterized protein (TIGR03086 family)